MTQHTRFTVGVDLGDRFSNYCVLDGQGEVVKETRMRTTQAAFAQEFPPEPRLRIALEVGTHSPWVSRTLESAGHEVIVADPRQLALISKNHKKSDESDPEILARLARADVKLLAPIEHRTAEMQADLAVIRARDAMVAVRTKLVNMVRGQIKSNGGRMTSCSAESFHKHAPPAIPEPIRPALEPVLAQLESITRTIREYDRRIEELAHRKYPQTELLHQVRGVGVLTALAFVLTVGKPERFTKSREVAAYFGLVPRRHASGESDPQLRITKRGDPLVRRLLVSCAQYILGPFGEASDLRDWGHSLAARGGKNGKKRAVVAVARKLAVLLHRLWITGQKYRPRRGSGGTAESPPSAERRRDEGPGK